MIALRLKYSSPGSKKNGNQTRVSIQKWTTVWTKPIFISYLYPLDTRKKNAEKKTYRPFEKQEWFYWRDREHGWTQVSSVY